MFPLVDANLVDCSVFEKLKLYGFCTHGTGRVLAPSLMHPPSCTLFWIVEATQLCNLGGTTNIM